MKLIPVYQSVDRAGNPLETTFDKSRLAPLFGYIEAPDDAELGPYDGSSMLFLVVPIGGGNEVVLSALQAFRCAILGQNRLARWSLRDSPCT
jgi:hypothetical protein